MGSDYLQLVMKFPIGNVLALLLLILLRILPIVYYAPFLGGQLLPSATKMGFAIVFGILTLPYVAPLALPDLVIGFPLVGLCLKELLVGTLFGFLTTIPFSIVTSMGALIDHQRGSASLSVTDPSSKVQTSPIGLFFNQLLLVAFFAFGGIHLFFEALMLTFKRIPPSTYLSVASFNPNIFWDTVINLIGTVFALTVQLAAPPIVAMLMADIFLGIANRLAPQVQIAFLGMSLKSLLGLIVLFIGFNFLILQIDRQTLLWFKKIYQIFTVFPIPAK